MFIRRQIFIDIDDYEVNKEKNFGLKTKVLYLYLINDFYLNLKSY